MTGKQESRIEEIKKAGFWCFRSLNNKPLKISFHSTSEIGIYFKLVSSKDQEYEFDIQNKEIDGFLANFYLEAKHLNKPETPQNKPVESMPKKEKQQKEQKGSTDYPIENNPGLTTISDIRGVLFDTLQKLQNDDIDVERAKTISDVSQTLLNSAKLEIQYRQVFGTEENKVKMLEEKK